MKTKYQNKKDYVIFTVTPKLLRIRSFNDKNGAKSSISPVEAAKNFRQIVKNVRLTNYLCIAASKDLGNPDGTLSSSPTAEVMELPSGFGAFGSFGLAAISSSMSSSS